MTEPKLIFKNNRYFLIDDSKTGIKHITDPNSNVSTADLMLYRYEKDLTALITLCEVLSNV
jgi:hypothetical protein